MFIATIPFINFAEGAGGRLWLCYTHIAPPESEDVYSVRSQVAAFVFIDKILTRTHCQRQNRQRRIMIR